MSTRATYLFKAQDDYRNDICLYIHHDGYESGAACYFYRAFLAGNGRIDAESMIRGNDRAEITGSHDTHGDTEYRYTLDGQTLTVEARHTLIEFGSYPKGWRTAFKGDWVDFINNHIDPSWLDDTFQPLKRLKIEYCESVYTPKTLQKHLDEQLRLCGTWATNGNDRGANWDSLKARIATMRELLSSYGEPEWKKAA